MKVNKLSGIEFCDWNGEKALVLTTKEYSGVLLYERGANLVKLKNKKHGVNILRSPDQLETFNKKPQLFGIPLLFPPNRISKGIFQTEYMKYCFPKNESEILGNHRQNHLHGFLRDVKWKIEKMNIKEDKSVIVELTYEWNDIEPLFTSFPHNMLCNMTYILDNNGLHQELMIQNLSQVPMPAGVGFHTAFSVPFCEDDNPDHYRLIAGIGDKWLLNEENIPDGKCSELEEYEANMKDEGIVPIGKFLFGHYTIDAIKWQESDFYGAVIKNDKKKVAVFYEVDKQFKHWVIWNENSEQKYICLEPQTWMTDAPNIKMSADVTGFKTIEPGEKMRLSSRIYADGYDE